MDDRGQAKLERLTFFSDAVFAIAMTLLVIEVRLPHLSVVTEATLGRALLGLLSNYIGFLVSFAVIARFWIGHHRLMGLLAGVDDRLVRANLVLMMAIAFMPFPTAVLSEYASLRVATGFYIGWLIIVGLANFALIRTAFAGTGLVRADAPEAEILRVRRTSWVPLIVGAVGFVSAMFWPLLGIVVLVLGAPLLVWLLVVRRSV